MAKVRTRVASVKAEPELTPQAKLAQAYRNTFSSESGQVVLDDLRKRFGRRRSFAADPYTTAFHEGQRDVYLLIMAEIDADMRDPEETR